MWGQHITYEKLHALSFPSLEYFPFLIYDMESEDQSSLWKFRKTLCIRDNIIAAMTLKTQNRKGHVMSLLPQSNKMHRLEYIMLKQPHICRSIMENTSPVSQSRVFLCATRINQNQESVMEEQSSEAKQLVIDSLQEKHIAASLAGVSKCAVLDLWRKIMLVNIQRRHILQLTRKVSNEKREKALFLRQYSNAPDVGWMQSGKDSVWSRIKVFNPLAFPNSLKTSKDREFLTVLVHPLLLDTERLHLWQPLWAVKQHQEADVCFWG